MLKSIKYKPSDAMVFRGQYKHTPHGKYRRALILNYVKDHGPCAINCKWVILNTVDPDVSTLIKKGYLKKYREFMPGHYVNKYATKKYGQGRSYVEVTQEGLDYLKRVGA